MFKFKFLIGDTYNKNYNKSYFLGKISKKVLFLKKKIKVYNNVIFT